MAEVVLRVRVPKGDIEHPKKVKEITDDIKKNLKEIKDFLRRFKHNIRISELTIGDITKKDTKILSKTK